MQIIIRIDLPNYEPLLNSADDEAAQQHLWKLMEEEFRKQKSRKKRISYYALMQK